MAHIVDNPLTPLKALAENQKAGHLWVAVDRHDQLTAFGVPPAAGRAGPHRQPQ
jgi:hypothetical protein